MGTTKRQRQREGRQSRLQQQHVAHRRASRRKRLVSMVIVAAMVLGGAGLISLVAGGDDDPADTTTTSAAPDEATLTPPPAGATVTGATPCPAADGSAERTTTFADAPPTCIDAARDYTAEIVTSEGSFTVDLLEDDAPGTVNNFVVLARYHYYDDVPFHRVAKDFVVQGGDHTATGSGGPGYSIPDELPEAGAYVEGSVAMANAGPDTSSSQFFVVTGGGPGLQPNYSLFGQVTSGLDVVLAIEDEAGVVEQSAGVPGPRAEVIIESVTITES